jgi:hypothetical protein
MALWVKGRVTWGLNARIQLTLQYESFDDNVNVQFTSIAPKIVHNYATWSGALYRIIIRSS